jgi:threonine dehydrogenase-like Zn-dependent dehydrogenase
MNTFKEGDRVIVNNLMDCKCRVQCELTNEYKNCIGQSGVINEKQESYGYYVKFDIFDHECFFSDEELYHDESVLTIAEKFIVEHDSFYNTKL